jgi:hypothetical protein
LFHHFFREVILKKEVFKFTTPICPCSPSNLYRHIFARHNSLDPLFQNLGIWIKGLGAVGQVSSVTYFSNLLVDKERRHKIKLTLNLRLVGYSIWSVSLIAAHI